MKTKLLTRNVCFGVLLTLVLMFSVQGIADALTFGTNRSGDLQTVVVNNEFTISFSVSLASNTTRITDADGKLIKDSSTDGGAADARIDSSGYLVVEIDGRDYRTIPGTPTGTLAVDPRPTYDDEDPAAAGTPTSPYYVDSSRNVVDSTGAPVYVQTGTGVRADSNPWRYTRAKADPNDKVPDANRYHYNEESISISAPSNVDLKRVGSYSVNVAGGTSHTMDEMKNSVNENKLTSSIRLTYFVDTPGPYTITIGDTTPADDRPGAASQPLSFTIFVVPAYDGTTDLALATTPINVSITGYQTRNDYADPQVNTLFASGANVPLVYSVEGSGRLYIEQVYTNGSPTSRSQSTNTLSTSEAAVVKLDMNGSSNKVTAYVRDQSAAETGKTITFIFNYAQIEIISGNDQMGVPNSRLIEPLGIRVKDAKGRALSGLAVTFDPSGNGTLKPVIGRDVYLTTTNTWANEFSTIVRTKAATETVPADILPDIEAMVPTDRNGEAEVYLELGAAGAVTVVVSVGGSTKTFNLTSAESTDIPSLEILSGNNQRSEDDGKVTDPLVVRALASNNQPFPTQLVTFTTTKGYLTTLAAYQRAASNGLEATINGPATQVTAQTDLNGKAAVSYDLVNHEGAAEVIAEISSTTVPTYQRRVTFNINDGSGARAPTSATLPTTVTNTITITPATITGEPGDEEDIIVTSSPSGQAVTIDSGDLDDDDFTRLSGITPFESTLVLPSEEDTYSFSATGPTGFTSDSATVRVATAGATGARIEIAVSGSGTTRTVTVTALNAEGGNVPGLDVTLRGTALIGEARTVRVGTPTSITVTTGTLQAAARGFVTAEETITVGPGAAPGDPSGTGTLTVQKDGDQIGTQQTLLVTASPAPSSSVDFTVTRGGVTVGSGTILTTGSGRGIVTVPTTGLYVLTVSAPGYASKQVTFTAGEQSQQPPQQQPPQQQQPTGSAPSSITISGLSAHNGTVNQPLDVPLAVRVLDANGVGVANARVIFRVVGEGQGRLSQRGNGRAIPKETDRNGFARADFTPLGAGILTVEAEARGVTERVTFTITTGSVPPAPGDPTPRTATIVSPVVNAGVSASSRPPMLWISGGKIYALVGSEVKAFISTVDNAISLAVGGGRVYWTAKTSDTHGTLNSANLDGTDAKQLRTLWGVPRGITVDPTGRKLYWVDAVNRLQSSNLDGSGIENVLRNLSDPKDVAVSGGNAYWVGNGDGTDTLVFINLSDPKKEIHPIAATSGIYGGLTIAGGKLYWTEQVSNTHGTLNSANLDGTQVKELRDEPIWGAPIGIAVDTARSRLYWTDAAGRLQSSNLDGSGIHNVAKGLGTPGDMVLSNSIMEPAEASSTTPTASTSKYDINEDGTVDSKDIDVLIVAILAELTDDKYDVNDDGKVNVADVKAVNANLDAGAAGAPTLLGTKLNAVEVDRLQEQIDLLVASGDRSPAALKTLIYLQQLLVMARPEKTQLLANYPNPFNPETWIPYELATDTDVRITIYNAQGVVIRTLQLGQQSAGYYTDRERAAYWDGRNALGEQVASGIYFYQLETDTMSSLRKMVILK